MAAARPVSSKGQGSVLFAQRIQQSSALLASKAGNGLALFIFALVSSCSGASSRCSYPARTPAAQGRGRESPTPGLLPLPAPQQLPSKAQPSDFLIFSHLDFTYHPVHTQEPHYILYSAQRVPTRILHSQNTELLKTTMFHHQDTPICNK